MKDANIMNMTKEEKQEFGFSERNERIQDLAEDILSVTLASIISGGHPSSDILQTEDPDGYDSDIDFNFARMIGDVMIDYIKKNEMDACDMVDVAKAMSPLVCNTTGFEITPRIRENELIHGFCLESRLTVNWPPKKEAENKEESTDD